MRKYLICTSCGYELDKEDEQKCMGLCPACSRDSLEWIEEE